MVAHVDNNFLKDLKPSASERLIIWRNRKQLSQVDAASAQGVSVDQWRDWEAGRRTHDVPQKYPKEIAAYERALIARRRAGVRQKDVAALLGVSRLWVNRMERGLAPPERLVDHWGV